MNCREFTEFLHEYLFSNLPAEERAEFDKHLTSAPGASRISTVIRRPFSLSRPRFLPPPTRRPPPTRPRSLSRPFFTPGLAPPDLRAATGARHPLRLCHFPVTFRRHRHPTNQKRS